MAKLIGEVIGRIATLLGWDGVDFYPLKTDASGQLLTGDAVSDEDLQGVQLTRVADTWEYAGTGSASSGNITITSDVVPTGYLAVVQLIAVWIGAGSGARWNICVNRGGVAYYFYVYTTVALNISVTLLPQLVLAAGDSITVVLTTAGASTTAYLRVLGYLVKVG